MRHACLYISLPVFARLWREHARLKEYVNRQRRNFLSLSELGYGPARNSTPGEFANIWQSKSVGIIAIKTERTQIHFLRDVLVAVASLDLKVPYVLWGDNDVSLDWWYRVFHSRGQHLCKFIKTKESVCIRKEFNSQRTGLGHQHGRRDVIWKHSIILSFMTNFQEKRNWLEFSTREKSLLNPLN